jgi:hypothetical protein
MELGTDDSAGGWMRFSGSESRRVTLSYERQTWCLHPIHQLRIAENRRLNVLDGRSVQWRGS